MKKAPILTKILTALLVVAMPANLSLAAVASSDFGQDNQVFYENSEKYKDFDGARYVVKIKDSRLNSFQSNFSSFGIKNIEPLFSQDKFNAIANGKFANVFIVNFNDKNKVQDNLIDLMSFAEYIEPDVMVYPSSSLFVQDSNGKYIPQEIYQNIPQIMPQEIPQQMEVESAPIFIDKAGSVSTIAIINEPEDLEDTFYFSQWFLNNTGQRYWARDWNTLKLILVQGTPDSDIDWPEAIAYLKDRSPVNQPDTRAIRVADIGGGLYCPLSDLKGRMFTNAGEIPNNNIDDDNNGFIDDVHGWDFGDNDNEPVDESGHSTHIFGIMSALTNNSKGVAGMAENFPIKIVPIKFFSSGNGYYSNAVKSFIYAANLGVDVINVGWIGPDYDSVNLMQDAVNYAYDSGALIFAAAGNFSPQIDAQYIIPASLDNVVAISATGDDDQLGQWYANFGKVVKVLAPGDDVLSAIPYFSYPSYEHLTDQGEFYTPLTGTSMATAVVSGTAAILKIFYPNKYDVLARILYTTEPLKEDYDHELGGGRLNLYNAASVDPYPVLDVEKIEINDFKNSDKDGILNQKETAWLKIYLKNNWAPLRKIKATLEYGNDESIQCVDILNNQGVYPDLDSGEVASEIDGRRPFEIFIKRECRDNAKFLMKLRITGLYNRHTVYEKDVYFDLIISPSIQHKKTLNLNEFIAGMAFGDLSMFFQNYFVAATIDGKILIINNVGKIERSWQVYLPNGQPEEFFFTNQPTLYDLNNDGKKEIIIGSKNGYLYVFNLVGSNLPGFPYKIKPTKIEEGPIGFPPYSTVEIRGAALVTDLGAISGQPDPKIIFGADNFKMYILDRFGKILPGWPIETEPGWTGYVGCPIPDDDNLSLSGEEDGVCAPYGFEGQPKAVDLDGDGAKEIIAASVNGKIYIWKSNGEHYPGWPVKFDTYGRAMRSEVSVGDVDEDGIFDISVDSIGDATLGIYDQFGNIKPGWPQNGGFISGDQKESVPHMMIDINNDGKQEMIFAFANKAYVLKYDGQKFNKFWPREIIGEDIWGKYLNWSGWSASNGQKAVANLDRDPELEIVLQTTDVSINWGEVFAYNIDGSSVVPAEISGKDIAMIGRIGGGFVRPVIADIDGDSKNEIIAMSIWGRMMIFDTMGKYK